MLTVQTLILWGLVAIQVAAFAGTFNFSTIPGLERPGNATPTKTTLEVQAEQFDDSAPTLTWGMIKPRPTRTVVPDWISPDFDPRLDNPVWDPTQEFLFSVYQNDAPRNNIPERIMAGPTARTGVAPSNDGGTRQIMFHQANIYNQCTSFPLTSCRPTKLITREVQYAAQIYREMMSDPANVLPHHPGLSQNGEVWPRPMRSGGNLVSAASSAGELDFSRDLILEFPFGEGNTYFGVDFANVNPPGQPLRRHIPSNHLLIFGYHHQDIGLQRPLYIGMITREGYTATTRTNWHWCPVVNYDATAGPPRNDLGYVWQGINPTFRLGIIAYFLRDWLIHTPFVKQRRDPRRHVGASDGANEPQE